jgi:hypothetical protein
MFLTYDTTTVRVADRRVAREAAARQHRRFRLARSSRTLDVPAPTRLPVPAGRTPVGTAAACAA